MTPLPKRRFSRGRAARRKINLKLTAAGTVKCANCGQDKRPHYICSACGK
ncbi:MAG: 50S ribosomal protein L32 [candidate division WWE3 bacterium]|nr:50S ribosomal protein L32 [candidate division WWE3 bacterium]